jgi:two-component system response regulator HydG
MLGQAPAMQDVFRAIGRLSQSSVTVLITGESGSGKELVAHALHRHSNRAAKAFIAINTAAIPRDLLESELFGHERGSFTGATTQRRGRFEEAEGGTLFLDEVGNLPAEVQQKLLRALQTKCYRPTGCTRERKADVRIVAATNENLEKAVEEGRFRRDLYHRLKEFVIKIPPLRECREDILPLAEFFRELANEELGRHTEGFDKEAEKELMRRMWAGNVRELKQTVRSAVLLTEGRLIGADRLEAESTAQAGSSLLLKDGNEERERIVRALAQADGNREVTAGLLGISRTTLYNKMKEYGIMQKKSEK